MELQSIDHANPSMADALGVSQQRMNEFVKHMNNMPNEFKSSRTHMIEHAAKLATNVNELAMFAFATGRADGEASSNPLLRMLQGMNE